MNSSETAELRPARSRLAWVWPTTQLGFLLFARENPVRPVLAASFFRNVAEALLFTLIGVAVGGRLGGDFSFVGAVALTLAYYTLAQVSDVPIREKIDGTYFRLARSGLSTIAVFAVRSVPLILVGILATVITGLIVGALTGRLDQFVAMASGAPLLVAASLSCTALGLLIIAPVIGTRYGALMYNSVALLVTLFSGALVRPEDLGLLAPLGSVLPLTHAIAGIRDAMAGENWSASLLGELAVAAAWSVAAAVAYMVMDRRARLTGRGALA